MGDTVKNILVIGMGNVLMQAKANGQIQSIAEGRKMISQSIELSEYEPSEIDLWNAEYQKSKQTLNV